MSLSCYGEVAGSSLHPREGELQGRSSGNGVL